MPNVTELLGIQRKLKNEELYNLYCSRSFAGRMRWPEHAIYSRKQKCIQNLNCKTSSEQNTRDQGTE
jgi:hypothetical protein